MSEAEPREQSSNEADELGDAPVTSVRVLASLTLALRDKFGEAAARDVLSKGGLTLETATALGGWISLAQQRAIFEAARAVLGSDAAFVDANGYRARDALGPFAYVIWAARPALMMDLAFRSMEFFSRVATGKVVARAPSYLRARYTSKVAEPRLFCLARIGAMKALPTMWNLAPAEIHELSCIAWGNDVCEYEVRWREPGTHRLTVAGALAGALFAGLAAYVHPGALAFVYPAPLLAAAVGFLVEARRRRVTEERDAEDIREAVETLSRESDDARREFASLSARQREWLAQVELEVAERSARVRRAFVAVDGIHAEDEQRLRAVSHDLAMPLMVLRTNLFSLRDALQGREPMDDALVREQLNSVARVERLLGELARVESTDDDATRDGASSRIEIADLAARVSRRLSAFALGRAIRVSVSTREPCPPSVYTDVGLLDRVLDNLLSNAVKYTADGGISVLFGGAERLEIVVTDTGRGMHARQLSQVFEPGGSEPSLRAPGSRGIGLSVVKRLVHRLRGSIEVSSRPGGGTTFRIQLPLDLRFAPTPSPAEVLRVEGSEP